MVPNPSSMRREGLRQEDRPGRHLHHAMDEGGALQVAGRRRRCAMHHPCRAYLTHTPHIILGERPTETVTGTLTVIEGTGDHHHPPDARQ